MQKLSVVVIFFLFWSFMSCASMTTGEKANVVVLKKVAVVFKNAKFTKDLTINRDENFFWVKGIKVFYDELIEDVIDDILASQDAPDAEAYVFIGGCKEKPMVIKIGNFPIDEMPEI